MAHVRIFVSSPGDVVDERRRAAIVVNRLAREFARFFALEAVLWEYEPMLASGHFQDAIVKPSETDIVVLILWSRLGTSLPEKYRGIDGRAPVTGTEWEFEEALASNLVSGLPDLLVYRKDIEGIARFSRREQLDAARAQWEALEAFWQRHFVNPEGGFRAAFNSFHDLNGFESQLEQHLRQILRQRLPAVAVRDHADAITWTEGSPFRGLEAYEAEHAAIFFGREQAETEVIEALARAAETARAFLLVLGASGSGKSSLIRAGVIPALMAPGVATGVSVWRHSLFRPGGASGDLFDRLARALVEEAMPELPAAGIDAARLAQQFRAAPSEAALPIGVGLRAVAQGRSSGVGGEPRLVLLVDQLEELLTQPEITEAQRAAFVSTLAALAGSGQVWVIATLRSDFYHRIDELPGLRALSVDRQYNLAVPRPAEMGEIVRRPAAAAGVGYEIEESSGLGLDALIAETAGKDPGALPLVSFALDELYRRDIAEGGRSTLTLATYRAFGGLEGSIAKRAEEVCGGLPEAAVASVLRELVTQRADQEDASARPAPRTEVATTPERNAVVDELIAARLVVSAMGANGVVLRLAHEALIRRWPRLAELIAGDRAFLAARARLQEDRERWRRDNKAPDLLLPAGKRLAEGAELLAARRTDLDLPTAQFIEASVARDRAQTRRQLRRTRAAALALGLLALSATTLGLWGWRSSLVAQHNLTLATETANDLVFDLADKFRDAGVPAAIIADILDRARKLQDQLTAGGQTSPELRESQAEALQETFITLVAIGDAKAALVSARREHDLLKPLLAASPKNTRLEIELSLSEDNIGDALAAQGDPDGALAAYRDELALANGLTAEGSSDTMLSQVSRSDDKIGQMLQARGDLSGALASYRAALAALKTRAVEDSGSTDVQRAVAYTDGLIGHVLQARGDLADALASFRDGLAHTKALAAKDADNTEWRLDLSVTENWIGDVLLAQDDLSSALAAYRDSLAIAESLATKDPGNAEWQSNLALSDRRIGDALRAQGDLTGALASYRAALPIAKAVAAKDVDDVEDQFQLAYLELGLGDVLKAQGDLAGALAAYRDELALAKAGEIKAPGVVNWPRMVATTEVNIGDVLKAQGDLDGALAAYRDELMLGKSMATKDPGFDWSGTAANVDEDLGDVLKAQGDLTGAIAAYHDELALVKLMTTKDPGDSDWLLMVANADDNLGIVLKAQGDLADALAAYRDEVALAKAMSAKDPDDSHWPISIGRGDEQVGGVLKTQGDLAGALAAYRDELALAEQRTTKQNDARWWNVVAAAHDHIGDVLKLRGDLAGALASYRAELALAQSQAANDAVWQHHRAVGDDDVGAVLTTQGDLAGALAAYRDELAMRKALALSAPGDSKRQDSLAATEENIGKALQKQHDVISAVAFYRDSLTAWKGLAAKEPGNPLWQSNIRAADDDLGDALQAQGDIAGALDAFRDELDVSNLLARDDPDDAEAQLDLATSLYKLAEVGADRKANLMQALAILKRLDLRAGLPAERMTRIKMLELALAKAL